MPINGNYKLETWGASGGSYSTNATPSAGTGKPGQGGYSVGIVKLNKDDVLYIYVGGVGNVGLDGVGGFNGGGNSRKSNNPWNGGSGGGASDIRIKTDSLYARVIVAGGGGGLAHWNLANAGAGGGVNGINANVYTASNTAATAGTQISGGIKGYYSPSENSATYSGAIFGASGNFDQAQSGNFEGAGGGGGWYGGGSGVYVSAGGGSGWIYNANSFSNWQSGNPTDASKWLLNSTYYLTEASTIDGNTNMPNHNGNSTMTGNTGNGYAKITLIK